MDFDRPLIRATLIRRYKRFLADCRLPDGREVVAHCANPGSMTGLAEPGMGIWLEPNDDPRKKLRFGWRLVELKDGGFAGVDTGRANRVVAEALAAKAIPGLEHDTFRAEVAYGGGSRVDFLLASSGRPDIHLEVKSVTLSRMAGLAEFPDSRTARGAKHLDALAEVVRSGGRAVMLYLVQRTDCAAVTIAGDIDPAYAESHRRATAAGVEVMALGCRIGPEGIVAAGPLPFQPPSGGVIVRGSS
jgi:sugar fermentation stimulation protein A